MTDLPRRGLFGALLVALTAGAAAAQPYVYRRPAPPVLVRPYRPRRYLRPVRPRYGVVRRY